MAARQDNSIDRSVYAWRIADWHTSANTTEIESKFSILDCDLVSFLDKNSKFFSNARLLKKIALPNGTGVNSKICFSTGNEIGELRMKKKTDMLFDSSNRKRGVLDCFSESFRFHS